MARKWERENSSRFNHQVEKIETGNAVKVPK
jgi:hypothetical protein